ncbi:MAG: hypothetical protein Q8P10_01775 [bacterium]|nr:hypothetical protein [bacterium]
MGKTQRILRLFKNDFSFFILTLIIIIGLFLFLSPKISSQLFPLKRQAILNDFINSTKQKGSIDPQEYWKFRDFYSPGYFIFSRSGIEETLALQTKEKIGIKYNEKNIDLIFLDFSSPLVNSLDMLTTSAELNEIIDQEQLQAKNIIFMNTNSLIYEENPRIIKIVFLLDNNDMKKANGFFDYGEKDKKLVENKNWLNITTIKNN